MENEINNEIYLLHSMMNHIEDNIYFKDHEGHFVMNSLYGAKWYGYDSPAEVVGKTDFDIFTPEHAKEAFLDEKRIIETGEPLLGKEEKETWHNGRTTWVSTSKIPLYNRQGKIIGTFGISRDITSHKNAEIRAERFAEENRKFRAQMEHELKIAGELQHTFQPTTYPTFPTDFSKEKSRIQFAHHYQAGAGVSGDFCSIKKISETEAGIFLCDVMGHGVRAALVTALIRGLVEEISTKETDPGNYLGRLNNALHPILNREDELVYVTACYIIINTLTGDIRFSNAGHPSPLMLSYSDNNVTSLISDENMRGPGLAICSDAAYSSFNNHLYPNDIIMMFTDGIYEIADENDEEYGEDRLMDAALKHAALPLPDLVNALTEDALHFSKTDSFDDDVCLVGARLHT